MQTGRLIMCAIAVALIVGGAPAMAQQQSDGEQSAPAPNTAQGQLILVDAAAKTFAVRTEKGHMLFSYNDETKVVGADESASGLATMSGTDVKVEYAKKGPENIATRIEVLKKSSA